MNGKHRPMPAEQVDHDLPGSPRPEDMQLKPQNDLADYCPAGKMVGKVALVTGGDTGIGHCISLAFAMEGADVAVVHHGPAEDAAGTARLVEAQGGRCLLIRGDVSKKAECISLVAHAAERLGRLDVLVNNAASLGGSAGLEDLTEDMLRSAFETNVFGAIYLSQAALPHLERTGGSIINTSSTTSYLGKATAIPYSASKGAINVMTRSMAMELAPRGVRVNAVAPGPVWTPQIATQPEEVVKAFGGFTMLGRAGQPEEIAPAYVYLASADSSFVTGMLMDVSGGFRSADPDA